MKDKKKMNKTNIVVAYVFVMTVLNTNIYPNGRSIAQSKQINLSGNWNQKNTPNFTGFTFSDLGCTAGFNGEIRTTVDGQTSVKRNEINFKQEGNKLIFPTFTNTYTSIDSSGSFKIDKSGFVSGNKVHIESVAMPNRGGIIRIVSIGTISNDGNTIKGKRTCTYSEGKAIAEQNFIWQRISNPSPEVEKYEVRLRLFIPSPALTVEASDDLCIINNAFCIFGGDNRRFSYNAPSHRYIANTIVTTDPKSTSGTIGKPFSEFCPTKRYLPSQGSHPSGKPSWWLVLKPGTTPLETKTLTLDRQVNSVNGALVPGKTNTVKVSFKVSGSNPLVATAPPFDADINVFIQNKLGEKPLVRVEGKHDGFPGYEIYVNRQLVYGYDPEKEGATPFNLFGTSDITISKPWSQWSLINNKYTEQKLPSCENSQSNFNGFGDGSSGGSGASGRY